MQIMNMFASMLNRYQFSSREIVNQINSRFAPGHNRELLPPTAGCPTRTGWGIEAPDSYLPSAIEKPDLYDLRSLLDRNNPTNELVASDQPSVSDLPVTETDEPPADDITPPATDGSDAEVPAPTQQAISIERRAELGYNLTLQFDLAAFTHTVTTMADGELSEIDALAIAGFGLSTDFKLSGSEVIRIDGVQSEGRSTHMLGKSALHAQQASLFAAQAQDFQVQAFTREATNIRRSIDIKNQDHARRAVNKFALRYRNDSSFSFSFAERLNIQTEQINNEVPESLGGYLGSAGELAATGTSEMMGAFFDAVDGYLTANREQTLESVTALFGQAASALGFSDTEVAQMAEAHLGDTIDSFFDKVQSAVADLRVHYLGETPATPDLPVSDQADLPIGEPVEYSLPVTDSTSKTDQQLMAVA